ncbi:hypothetical protein EVAR_99040_1 [Eumeta japonica]|uniref:Uncharacterized protein n=1 Tax=Eumeta variegata TaxID=151549 RepID=A0A4C1Y073_EUMVA|nr:hypothetical protein EVAR_99040_1 [Eumeta japonica]
MRSNEAEVSEEAPAVTCRERGAGGGGRRGRGARCSTAHLFQRIERERNTFLKQRPQPTDGSVITNLCMVRVLDILGLAKLFAGVKSTLGVMAGMLLTG